LFGVVQGTEKVITDVPPFDRSRLIAALAEMPPSGLGVALKWVLSRQAPTMQAVRLRNGAGVIIGEVVR
jgi:hypothetical protein